jgi:hypothetical protein
MADMDLKSMLLIVVVIAFIVIIAVMVLRIFLKVKKEPTAKTKKTSRVLKAVPTNTDSESDSIFNSIVSTKRISGDLKRRGVDVSRAEQLIKKAESEYDLGRQNNARRIIDDAKDLLLKTKDDWDQKTGFDVEPKKNEEIKKPSFRESVDLVGGAGGEDSGIHKPEKEFPELKKAVGKKPDNFLPSKFTISLAQKAVDDANSQGADTSSATAYLIDARHCYSREDYDEAFRLALCCKREAEAVLGAGAGSSSDEGISDLSVISSDSEPLKTCSICGNNRVAYICIESDSGEEATCKQCYDKTMSATVVPDLPPPPPPPDQVFAQEEKKETIPPPEESQVSEHRYCPNCGAKVKVEDVFCGKCGKPVQEELKCVGCGEKVEPGDVFCRKCGARLVT